MIDFPTLYPSLTKYLPNWLERFYPSIARFGKGDGYPCGNQGVFIPKNRKCWTHPKTGQKLKKPLTYQMYQEAKAKSQKSRTEKGRTALERREQELRQLNKGGSRKKTVAVDSEDFDLLKDLFGAEKKQPKSRNLFLKSKSKQVDLIKNKQEMARLEKANRDYILSLEAKVKREQLLKMLDDAESGVASPTYRAISSDKYFDRPYDPINSAYKKVKDNIKNLSKGGEDSVIREQEDLLKKIKQVEKDFDDLFRKAKRLIKVDNPTKINFNLIANTPSEQRAINKGVSAFSQLIDIPDWTNSINIINDQKNPVARSYYKHSTNTVVIGKQSRPSHVVHELAHWLERNHPEVQKEIGDFYDKRTTGEKVVKLKDIYPNGGYLDDELTKVDKWLHPYIGKVNKRGSTEVLSVGLQLMEENPFYLAKKDPEMFDFIYKVVRRGIRRK